MKKLVKILAVLMVASLVLTACGTGKETPSTTSDAPASSTAPKAETPAGEEAHMRFMWWGGDARHEATLKVIEEFENANPGVSIDAEYGGMDGYYQKLTTQISSGTEPDIIQIVPEWFMPLGRGGDVFYNLDESGIIDVSGFDQEYLASTCSIDGRLQGLPTGGNGSIMAINKDFMERFDIAEDFQWDWETLKTKGAEIHAQDPESYLLGGYVDGNGTPLAHLVKYHIMQQPGATGWVNSDFTLGFTQEHVENAFNYFLELLDNGTLQPVEETSLYKAPLENPAWINGNVGMVHSMPSTINIFDTDTVTLDATACPFDADAADSGVVSGPPQFLVISKNSSTPEVAEKFIDFFFNNEEAVATLGTVRGPQPTSNGTKILLDAGEITELDFKASEIVQETASKNFNLYWLTADFEVPYNDACGAVMFKTSTPEQAAKKMIEDFEEACENLKATQ